MDRNQLLAWLILCAAVYGLAYWVSIRLHPYKPCRDCGMTNKHFGAVFTRNWRPCRTCKGKGRQLRWLAKKPPHA